MRLILINYHFGIRENVAAQRWHTFRRHLRSVDLEIIPITAYGQESGQFTISDPLQVPFQLQSGGLRNKKKSKVYSLLPFFLLIDRQWLWSLKLFFHLLIRKIQFSGEDLFVVSGPPWSSMVAVSLFAKLKGLRYWVDCRDLWSQEPILHFDSPTARCYFRFLERFCLTGAERVISVNEPLVHYYSKISKQKVIEIPNGYDGDLSWNESNFNQISSKKKFLLYAGTISYNHDFESFLKAYPFDPTVPLHFIGKDFMGVLDRYPIANDGLLSPELAQSKMHEAGVLVLTLASTSTHSITGKLMNYLKAGRPILYFGPPSSPAAQIIQRHGLGWIVSSERPEELKPPLKAISQHFAEGTPFNFQPDIKGLESLSSSTLSKLLTQELQHSHGLTS